MDQQFWTEGTFCQYRGDSKAEIFIRGSRYLCPLSLFSMHDPQYPAKDLRPGCPLSICMSEGKIIAARVVTRQSVDLATTDRIASLGTQSLPRWQEGYHANPAPMGIITTPEGMKFDYDQSFREKIYSDRVFPIWILSEQMGNGRNTIENLEIVERNFEGFRRMNIKENAFFLAVSVALVQGLLFLSTPVKTRQDYFRFFNQPSLNQFAGLGPYPSLHTLSTLRDNKALWTALTDQIEFCVISHRDKELADFVFPEEANSREASQTLIRATAEALSVSLTVYSPRDRFSKIDWEVKSACLRIALIKDSGFYYPLLTRQELIEEGYDVYTCSFIENPALNQTV